jgi:hypothetical protein
MKRSPALLGIAALLAVACGKSSSTADANTMGGDPNVPAGTIGSVIDSSSDLPAQMVITANNAGVITLRVTANVASVPALQRYVDLMPASMKTGASTLAFDTTMKVTSEGIQDTFNADHALHTIVKYGATVGDTYPLTKGNGVTVMRTVKSVSTTDDFPYGLYMIKVTKVEQDSRVPGIRAFRIYANHRFGIVQLEIVNDDNSVVALPVYHSNLN